VRQHNLKWLGTIHLIRIGRPSKIDHPAPE
jgi:hypothetical protein